MSKARTLADFISDGSEFADGTISVAEVSGAAPLASPTFTGNVDLGDNVQIRLGDDNDLRIYHDVSTGNSYIWEQGTGGELWVLGTDIRFANTNFSSNYARFVDGGEVELFHGNQIKLSTAADGVDITGDVGATTATIAGKTTTDELDLNALAATISDTAVDIFVYDTRKDSDGGAWRKRTQHTSWYNETLNTATRGSRKEFPAVAVIVAESTQVTIYDGDDPDLPMWMVFDLGINKAIGFGSGGTNTTTSCHMLNGLMFVGVEDTTTSNPYSGYINFITEQNRQYGSGTYDVLRSIVDRNSSTISFQLLASSYNIVDPTVNDVAMTVLPNAPIDAATGLPVPTIAVATDGGVSVIKDDGTVVDITESSNSTNLTANVEFLDNGKLVFRTDGNTSYKWVARLDLPSSDRTYAYLDEGDMPYVCYTAGADSWRLLLSPPYIGDASTDTTAFTSYKDNVVIGTIKGFGQGTTDPTKNDTVNTNLVNYTSSSYNTGWMNGDVKLATLSDTDDTDVTGSELVTNGTFDTDVSSWVAGDAGSGVSYDSGTLLLTNNDNSPAFVGSAYFTTVVGKTYVFSFDVTARSNPSKQARILVVGQTAGIVTDSGAIYDVGSYSVTFTANDTSTQVLFSNGNQTASTGTFNFDNVSVRLAEEDRSVNGNGLQVFGTVTKNPVATGADLVAYSGFSASNYLEQPVNSDLTGAYDSCFMGWMKTSSTSGYQYIFALGTSGADVFGLAVLPTTGYLYAYDDVNGQDPSSTNVADEIWHHVCLIHKNGVNKQLYVDGKLINTFTTSSHTTSSDAKYRVGRYYTFSNEFEGSLALQRFSKTIPSSEQIKKIYEDEKVLFQENAQATLYGSSDAVTALAYDDSTELLHVGTSAGRSVFQGLRRVDNTTTAVGAAISASNGLVADE